MGNGSVDVTNEDRVTGVPFAPQAEGLSEEVHAPGAPTKETEKVARRAPEESEWNKILQISTYNTNS
jgi:hypothetical protein